MKPMLLSYFIRFLDLCDTVILLLECHSSQNKVAIIIRVWFLFGLLVMIHVSNRRVWFLRLITL
ncbi:hypothetical protein Hanom_Chr06g00483521 [Helianthus anomalus]